MYLVEHNTGLRFKNYKLLRSCCAVELFKISVYVLQILSWDVSPSTRVPTRTATGFTGFSVSA
jgi:hypothetical protein